MTPESRAALERARAEFRKKTEGMTEDEVAEHVNRLVRKVRRQRALELRDSATVTEQEIQL
jgi:hypothetical protein